MAPNGARNAQHGTHSPEPGTRLARLRRRVTETRPSICHERAALVTRRYQRDEGRSPSILLRAHALADVNGESTILRAALDEVISHRRSLMPELLEAQLSLQQMADLLAFMAAASSSTASR